MNDIEKIMDDQGERTGEVNVEVPEKPVDSFAVEQTKTPARAMELEEAVQNKQDEVLDLLMKNIKEFIRSIDVKTL